METIKWDKIRVLVTNKCNYRCSFCHNEGQSKMEHRELMTFENFRKLIDFLKEQPISEINFSGGEPFLNPEIVEMIQYANEHMKCDLSCATNLSLISERQINSLANTRIKFNIQFPFASNNEFAESTGIGTLDNIVANIKAVKEAGLKIGLNSVIQSKDTSRVDAVINFALINELPLKLLPQIGLVGSEKFIEDIKPIILQYSLDFVDKGTGCLKWTLSNGVNQTTLLYIQSPCFDKDIETCRKYGEVRVHPDLSLQPCIMKERSGKLRLENGEEYVINQFEELWKGFNHC